MLNMLQITETNRTSIKIFIESQPPQHDPVDDGLWVGGAQNTQVTSII